MDHIKIIMGKMPGKGDDAGSEPKPNSKTTSSKAPNSVTASVFETESDSCDCFPSLTRTQRLWGFGICFCVGYLISFTATVAFLGGSKSGARFGVLYSMGNIIALCGSGFLVGPKKQLKLMSKPERRIAAAIYLSMIFVVLAVAILAPQLGLLIFVLVFIQFIAGVWYAASFVPFGRNMIKKICGTITGS